ncbi:hypothetical protein Trydic_g14852 [Trypoxylus dichotomus]
MRFQTLKIPYSYYDIQCEIVQFYWGRIDVHKQNVTVETLENIIVVSRATNTLRSASVSLVEISKTNVGPFLYEPIRCESVVLPVPVPIKV